MPSADKTLITANKEHFTQDIAAYFLSSQSLDVLMPASSTKRINTCIQNLDYKELMPAFSVAETGFGFSNSFADFRLITQKEAVP